MKYFLPILGIIILSSCGVKNNSDPRVLSISDSLNSTGNFGKSLKNNTDLRDIIQSSQQLVIVIPSDKAIDGTMLNTVFFKNYISQSKITEPGIYKNLNGQDWDVSKGYPGNSEFYINNIKINGCARSYTNEQQARQGNWSYLCFTDSILK